MSVLLTNFYGDMGGGEFALLAHARWLARKGTQVHVCLFREGPFVEVLGENSIGVQVIPARLDCGPRGAILKGVRLVPRLIGLIRRIRPRYVVCCTPQELPFVAIAGRLCGVPVVYRDQAGPDEGAAADWREDKMPTLSRRWLAGSITTTRARLQCCTQRGCDPSRLAHVYLGVDTARVAPVQGARAFLQAELPLPAGAVILGLFGRLIDWKGQATLLEAMGRLSRPAVHALLVGGTQLNDAKGPAYVDSLAAQASRLGLAGQVHFTGFRKDVGLLMSGCDIICHASWWEAFGLVLVEGMLCGKPLVASDVSGPREIVEPGVTGLLFPPRDAEAMANCLRQLIDEPDLRQRMGGAARERALGAFDQERNLQRLDEVIWQFLRQPRRRRGLETEA